MKRVLTLMVIAIFFACTPKEQGAKLEKETPNYELATKLAEKVEWLDPEKNMVLSSTDFYEVTAGDVVRQMRVNFGPQINMLPQQSEDNLKRLVEEYAKRLAERQMLLRDAKKEGITVPDSVIEQTLQMQYQQTGGEQNFQKMLAQHNIPLEALEQEIRVREVERRYMEKVNADALQPSDSELDSVAGLDRYATVRHILLLDRGKSDEEKAAIRSKMDSLLNVVRGDADFAELAKQYSEDPGSKERGGLYEDFPRGQMVPAFDSVAFNAPIGSISDVIKTDYGYHIVEVLGRKKEDRSREEIANELRNSRMFDSVEKTYADLREEYGFELMIEK